MLVLKYNKIKTIYTINSHIQPLFREDLLDVIFLYISSTFRVKARLVPKHESYLWVGYTLLFAMLVDVMLSNLYRKLSNTLGVYVGHITWEILFFAVVLI